ncbi:MAG TPA: glycosyltransferase family 87 protein [Caulobacteraceae bacterium]
MTWSRVRAYATILLAGYVLGWLVVGLTLRHGLDPRGAPPGADFIIFYGVSRLTLAGQAIAAYAPHALLMAERTAVPASRGVFLWCYPPTFQLMVWPLGLLRYAPALAAWTAAGLIAYLATIRSLSGDRRAWLLALAFPGLFMNASQGQTGFWITALLGGGLLLLDARPALAGVLIGLLAIKPQFAVLAPLLMILAGRPSAVLTSALTALVLAVGATAAFGVESWPRFLAAAGAAARALEAGALPLYKDPSVFAALRLFGAPTSLALAVHAAQAVLVIVLTAIAWRRPGPAELKAGLGVLATLIVLPYLFDYDLMTLAVPIAVGLKAIHGREGLVGARIGLVAMAVTPILVGPVGRWLHAPIGPAALWFGYFTLWRVLARDAAGPRKAIG